MIFGGLGLGGGSKACQYIDFWCMLYYVNVHLSKSAILHCVVFLIWYLIQNFFENSMMLKGKIFKKNIWLWVYVHFLGDRAYTYFICKYRYIYSVKRVAHELSNRAFIILMYLCKKNQIIAGKCFCLLHAGWIKEIQHQ